MDLATVCASYLMEKSSTSKALAWATAVKETDLIVEMIECRMVLANDSDGSDLMACKMSG